MSSPRTQRRVKAGSPVRDGTQAREDAEPADIEAALGRLAPWKQRFIKALRLSPSVTAACRAGNCSLGTAKAARESDADFAQCWSEALEGLWDNVEEALYQEAAVGATVIKRDGSQEHQRDLRAMDLLLKAKRPAEYRDKGGGVTIHVGAVQDAIDQAVQSGLLTAFVERNLPAAQAEGKAPKLYLHKRTEQTS